MLATSKTEKQNHKRKNERRGRYDNPVHIGSQPYHKTIERTCLESQELFIGNQAPIRPKEKRHASKQQIRNPSKQHGQQHGNQYGTHHIFLFIHELILAFD